VRPVVILATLACASPHALAAPSEDVVGAAPGVRVYASADDRAITEGETVVAGSPDDVYAAMLDYRRWTDIFPDVAQVIVTRLTADEARVTLVARDGHRDNLHFKNQPAARMVWFEDTGNSHAEVWAEIVFVPAARPGATRVHTRLYANVHGVAKVVVGQGELRRKREAKVERDLASIRAYFRRR
jgi:hypothetical protein